MKTFLPFVFAFFTTIAVSQIKIPVSQNLASSESKTVPKIKVNNGSFFTNLASQNLSVNPIEANLNEWLGLSTDHTFREISRSTENLGILKQIFSQFYKGIPVNGSSVMLHSKNGTVTVLNGTVASVEGLQTNPKITAETAERNAMTALNVVPLTQKYPVELVIVKVPSEKKKGNKGRL